MEHKEKAVGSKAAMTACSVFNSLEITEGQVGHGNQTGGGEAAAFFFEKKFFERSAPHPISWPLTRTYGTSS